MSGPYRRLNFEKPVGDQGSPRLGQDVFPVVLTDLGTPPDFLGWEDRPSVGP